MDLQAVFFAAACFFFYAIGRMNGIKHGNKIGKEWMRAQVVKDIKENPTKWRQYIDEVEEA